MDFVGLAVCVFNEVIMIIIIMSNYWSLFVFDVSWLSLYVTVNEPGTIHYYNDKEKVFRVIICPLSI